MNKPGTSDHELRIKYLEKVVENLERRLEQIERHLRYPGPRPFFGEEKKDA